MVPQVSEPKCVQDSLLQINQNETLKLVSTI